MVKCIQAAPWVSDRDGKALTSPAPAEPVIMLSAEHHWNLTDEQIISKTTAYKYFREKMRVTSHITAHHFLTLVFTCHVNEEKREDQLRISTRQKTYWEDLPPAPRLKEYKVLTPWQHLKTLTSPWGCTLSSLVRLTPLCTDYTALPQLPRTLPSL